LEDFLLQFFQNIAGVAKELHYQYTEQFLMALLPMAVTVFLHGEGMALVSRCMRRFAPNPVGGSHNRKHFPLLVLIVAIILATHFFEVVAWAIFYGLTGALPDAKVAMFYSINSYTTLGASDIIQSGLWKGVDGFEAMTGMLMFGWSTAVLAVVVQKLHSLD
jgi:hypothetical protein